MNTKEFKVGDRIEFMAGEPARGTVVQIRDYEPSLCVCWDEYVGKHWYITSSGVFQKIDDDISDEDKDLVTDIINNVKTMNSGLPSLEEVTSAWRKAIKDLESEGELKLKDDGVKVGDRVECVCSDDYGVLAVGEKGIVIMIEQPEPSIGVQWDNYHEEKNPLYGSCEDGYGFWVSENSVKKIRDVNKNQVLSPKEMLKAGMVVEIANGDIGLFDGKRIACLDDFYDLDDFNDDLQEVEGDEEFLIIAIYKPNCPYNLKNINKRVDKFEVVWKKEGFKRDIKKEFSKDELTILENLYLDGHKYLARDERGGLWAYSDIPEKEVSSWSCHFCDNVFLGYVSKLFKYISWEDEKPTKISDYI